jgi:oxygen-independent coproporphyrinogen III oxidase
LAGIYLHIPFCKQACAYCNFHFTTSLRYKDELVQALKKEILLEKEFFGPATVQTIYFGGGTPSLLTGTDCIQIMETLHSNFNIDHNAEITLEANPDDISHEKLKAWKNAGINRLSIGVQTFFEEELQWMNRAHNAGHAKQCIEWSLENGFHNLSVDLIYGSPLLSDEMWEENVNTVINYNIQHVSCYALTVEEKTPLHKEIKNLRTKNTDDEKQARQFLLLMKWLKAAGYEHYEVSNFAKPGCRSRHNSSYWKGLPYLGLGPSAHSYKDGERRWNISNNNIYIRSMADEKPEREKEILSKKDRINELIMISLRTKEGLDFARVENEFGSEEKQRIVKGIEKYFEQNLLIVENEKAFLTEEGMLSADGIASGLFRLR